MDIDFVIPCVDGIDPEWLVEFNKYALAKERRDIDRSEKRYRSRNAFYTAGKMFCLAYAIVMVFISGLLNNNNEIVPYTNILGG